MEVSRLVSRLVGQRHNKTDPGTTKREPQSISLPDAPPQFSAQFDSRVTPDAPDIWRTLVRPYVDTQIETGIQPFTAQMSGTHLGDSLISRSTCSATVQHRRTALDVRRSQVDHLLIQLFVAGGTRGDYGKNPVDIRAGSIGLLDLGQTLHTRTTLISTITLTVPRDRLPTALRSRKLHGALLDPGQGATRMLASHLSQLAQHASSLTREEMSASVNAGLILLSGSLSTLRDGEDDGPARQVVRNGMRRLVRNISSATSMPDICRRKRSRLRWASRAPACTGCSCATAA